VQIGPEYLGIVSARTGKTYFKIVFRKRENDMKKLALSLFCMMTITTTLFAKEEILATITNDQNQEIFMFVASTDENNQTLKAFFKDDYMNGKKTEREILPSKDLTREGVVLDKRGNHTVISLKSHNFDFARGGTVVIDTLFNGVTGERKEYEVELAKDKTGWKLYAGRIAVSKLHIVVNKKALFGMIGVKNIRMQ
jgi:hypothetical protein